MSSWAEDIQAFTSQKRAAPPATHVHRFVRKGTHLQEAARDFDIVKNTVKDPKVAANYERDRREATLRHIERGKEKELTGVYHGYNIITMEPRYGISEEDCNAMGGNQEPKGKRSDKKQRSSRTENIIAPSLILTEEKKPPKKQRDVRERNFLTHEYRENNEGKVAEDEKKKTGAVTMVAAYTRDLNPVTGKYFDVRKEEFELEVKESKDQDVRDRVANHTYKVSGIVARSEGHAFDIVTNQLYNPEYVLKLEQSNVKGIPQRAMLRQNWEYQRDAEEALTDSNVVRALSRVSAERLKETQRRGHDILSNKEFGLSRTEELEGKKLDPHIHQLREMVRPPLPMSSLEPQSVLQKLQQSTQPRAWTTSSVFRQEGPRTTHERLFSTPASITATQVGTFDGRRKLLLPTLKKTSTEPKLRSIS